MRDESGKRYGRDGNVGRTTHDEAGIKTDETETSSEKPATKGVAKIDRAENDKMRQEEPC